MINRLETKTKIKIKIIINDYDFYIMDKKFFFQMETIQ